MRLSHPIVDMKWLFRGLVVLLLGAGFLLLNAARLAVPEQRPDPGKNPAEHVRAKRLAEIDTRFKQGVAMLQAGQHEHAAVAFHRVLELSPRLPDAHVNLGYALLGLGRPKAAHDFFVSAIELKADQVNAYYGLALALEKLGDLPGALGAMRSYVHLAPPDAPQMRKARAAIWEWESGVQP